MTTREEILSAMPPQGLFAAKEWLTSPEPFALSKTEAAEIEALGWRLHLFLKACNSLYYRSLKGTAPKHISEVLDAGKPAELLELARAKALRDELPRVIRPDVILAEDGLAISEIDSVPGGIGLTGWLNQLYSDHGGWSVIGGRNGMVEGFRSLLPEGGDLIISQESSGYRPEMEWMIQQLGESWQILSAESDEPVPGREAYRFFELFDLPNLPAMQRLLQKVALGEAKLTAPPKPWLEEKLWMALFRQRPLHELWRRELSDNQQKRLEAYLPFSWLVDPAPLPPHAVHPRIGVHSWEEAGRLSQKERELVLKRSGFHEEAWGARSVTIGHDVSQPEWVKALESAQSQFSKQPYVLQIFRRARVVEHPYFDPVSGIVRTMKGRVRLCPYFFQSRIDDKLRLGGILATICPEDKKILHGMKDAIMVPCRIAEEP